MRSALHRGRKKTRRMSHRDVWTVVGVIAALAGGTKVLSWLTGYAYRIV